MLRTERISRSTKKENFLPLLGYEVAYLSEKELFSYDSFHAQKIFNFQFSIFQVCTLNNFVVSFRFVLLLCCLRSGF